MALLPIAFVDGREYAAEDVRRIVYAATNGATGLAQADPGVLAATSTPSGNVIVNAFVGYIASPVVRGQSYVATNDQATTLAVPPNNTSATVTYYVGVVVDDPQYPGTNQPADPRTATYGRLTVATSLPTASKPVLILGTITLPPNTGTVTNSMIRVTSRPANPRRERTQVVRSPNATHSLGTTYQQWPPSEWVDFSVPSWARRAIVRVDISGVEIMTNDYTRAELKPTLDGWSDDQPVMMTVRGQQGHRNCFFTVADFRVSSAQVAKGTVTVGLRGAVMVGKAGAFQIDNETNLAYDVEFLEA